MARLGIVAYHGIESGEALTRYGQVAEAAGFKSVWVTERYFHEEAFSLLGFLAAVTQRIKLGLGVTNPYTRSPAPLAMASATLDRICGGRFVLGLAEATSPRFKQKWVSLMPTPGPRWRKPSRLSGSSFQEGRLLQVATASSLGMSSLLFNPSKGNPLSTWRALF